MSNVREHTLVMLNSSLANLPISDSPRENKDTAESGAKGSYATPAYYPQQQLSLSTPAAAFTRFDADTLFYAFYYMQGTAQQGYAAAQLKKQYWRYHTKDHTWFQRHPEEMPSEVTAEYEKGTYIFFDYKQGWCQRKRSGFLFEYKYLESLE